ncbi:GNAT family N-acetyltransferase [Candidatus Microgenomates bacterium]|nr:GNAT family N-acetyltransferase [Candidatus Microgenomates bacterium]
MFIPGKIVKQFKTKKGNEVVIRYPKWEDLEQLTDFINNLSQEDTFVLYNGEIVTKEQEMEYLVQAFRSLERGNRIQLCAFVGDKLVANSSVIRKRLRAKHVGTIGISVTKGYREEGIGSEVIKVLIDESRKLGLKMLSIDFLANNERAQHVYQEIGFKECGCFPKMYFYKGEYVGQILMSLEL